MRDAFSNILVELAKADPNIVLLTGDHGYALFDEFRRVCPQQFINAGIAEQNMVGMAAGLAKSGFRPIVYGLAAFLPVRVLEQIKLDVAHDNLPVIFIGDGAGLVYSHLGTSHQSTEDIACTRAIPNLSIYSPADRFEMRLCMKDAYKQKKPVYLRVGKSDLGDVHTCDVLLSSNNLFKVRDSGSRLNLIAHGSMVKSAIAIADQCGDANVWSAPFLKPFHESQLLKIAENSELIATLEEHSVFGGLGGIVSELLSEVRPTKIVKIGIKDCFTKYCGTHNYLLKEMGLDSKSLIAYLRDKGFK